MLIATFLATPEILAAIESGHIKHLTPNKPYPAVKLENFKNIYTITDDQGHELAINAKECAHLDDLSGWVISEAEVN